MRIAFIASIACWVVLFSLLALVGCDELDDGYQFGDVTRFTARELNELERARQDYCDQNRDKWIRKAALLYLRSQVPALPADGICIGITPSGEAPELLAESAR